MLIVGQDSGPCIYFYSLTSQTTVKKVLGGEVFIDLIYRPEKPTEGLLYFVTDENFFHSWNKIESQKSLKSLIRESEPIIIRASINFEDTDYVNCITEVEKGKITFINEDCAIVYSSQEVKEALARSTNCIKWIKPTVHTHD